MSMSTLTWATATTAIMIIATMRCPASPADQALHAVDHLQFFPDTAFGGLMRWLRTPRPAAICHPAFAAAVVRPTVPPALATRLQPNLSARRGACAPHPASAGVDARPDAPCVSVLVASFTFCCLPSQPPLWRLACLACGPWPRLPGSPVCLIQERIMKTREILSPQVWLALALCSPSSVAELLLCQICCHGTADESAPSIFKCGHCSAMPMGRAEPACTSHAARQWRSQDCQPVDGPSAVRANRTVVVGTRRTIAAPGEPGTRLFAICSRCAASRAGLARQTAQRERALSMKASSPAPRTGSADGAAGQRRHCGRLLRCAYRSAGAGN